MHIALYLSTLCMCNSFRFSLCTPDISHSIPYWNKTDLSLCILCIYDLLYLVLYLSDIQLSIYYQLHIGYLHMMCICYLRHILDHYHIAQHIFLQLINIPASVYFGILCILYFPHLFLHMKDTPQHIIHLSNIYYYFYS